MRGPPIPSDCELDGDDGAARRGGSVPCVAGHGRVLDELRVEGIRVVCVDHAPGLAIHRHAHDQDKLVILLTGGATERIGQALIEHRLLDVVAREKFRAHENQYHASGARSLLVELDGVALAGQLPPGAARQHGMRLVAAFHARR
ncbi:MAG TPA: hypothetical protein VLM79_13665, partial [Kofleriaceae bacterium]|nr:hypothetical protein [Kofleriaceae bacterium]